MCGRFRLEISPKDIIGFYKLIEEIDKKYKIQKDILNLSNSKDIYPTNSPIILDNTNLRNMDWGFPLDGKLLVNGRSEKILTSNFYRGLLSTKKCLIPASSFYEWNTKRKYEIKTSSPYFFMAGLYNEFLDDNKERKEHFIILTTDADKDMEKIHHRMPCIIEEKDLKRYLSSTSEYEITSLLKPWNKGLNIALSDGEQLSFMDL